MANNQPSRINAEFAEKLGCLLESRDLKVITVESCTGGMVAAFLTSIPGSSRWFEGAFVTYRSSAKVRMVGVPQQILDRHGAVSEPTAKAMAQGALTASDADVSVAITGVAGPGGGDVVAPVGTVWFAWATTSPRPHITQTAKHNFAGDREAVRVQAVNLAVSGLLQILA